MRTKGLFLTFVLVLGVLAAAAGPASAYNDSNTYGTLKVVDLTTNGTVCVNEVVEFVPTASLSDWTMSVSVSDSNGDEVTQFELDAATTTHSFTLCPHRERAGYMRVYGYISGVGTAYNSGFNFRVIDRQPTALTVAVTRSYAKACPGFEVRPKHCSRVTGTLTRAGKPLAWDWVQIQAYKNGKWVRQAWGRTNGLGKVTWYVTITRRETRLKFRLFYPTHDYAKWSVSRSFRVYY